MSDASAPFFSAEEGVQECERESLPRFGLSFLVEDAFVLGTQGFSWFATTAACRVAPPRINNPWSMDLVSVVAVASVAGVGDEDGFRLGGERSPLRNAICDLFSCSLNTDVADLTDFCGVKMSLTPSERNAVFIVVPSERDAMFIVRNYKIQNFARSSLLISLICSDLNLVNIKHRKAIKISESSHISTH